MNANDKMIRCGQYVLNMLTKGNTVVCNECVVHHSKELYITIEQVGSQFNTTHKYICRYLRKKDNANKPILKSMKVFVVNITIKDDKFIVGIETSGNIVDYSILNKCVKLLTDMYDCSLTELKEE